MLSSRQHKMKAKLWWQTGAAVFVNVAMCNYNETPAQSTLQSKHSRSSIAFCVLNCLAQTSHKYIKIYILYVCWPHTNAFVVDLRNWNLSDVTLCEWNHNKEKATIGQRVTRIIIWTDIGTCREANKKPHDSGISKYTIFSLFSLHFTASSFVVMSIRQLPLDHETPACKLRQSFRPTFVLIIYSSIGFIRMQAAFQLLTNSVYWAIDSLNQLSLKNIFYLIYIRKYSIYYLLKNTLLLEFNLCVFKRRN